MIKQLQFLLLLCAISSQIIGQTIVTGTVLSEKNSPIPYMNIGVFGTNIGTVSNIDGKFSISIPSEMTGDTLLFSAIGYYSKKIIASEVLNEIHFEDKVENLATVEVRPSEVIFKTIGNKNTNSKSMVNFAISNQPNQNLGSEIGKKFSLSKKVWLDKIEFYVAKCSFDTALLLVNIREIKNGVPGRVINKHNLIVQVFKTNGEWKTLDLSHELIQVEGKFAIGIEWVGHSKSGRTLSLPISIPSIGSTHYYKYASVSKWKKYGQLSTAIQITYSYRKS